MLFSVIKAGVFQDSVSLMLLTKKVSALPGVDRLSVMMGTPANKEIFANTGLSTPEVVAAKPSDLCVVVDAADAAIVDDVMKGVEAFLADQSVKRRGADYAQTKTLDGALSQLPNADIALISVAGRYAARLAGQALDRGLNVFLFSDNVTVEAEAALKKKAHEKGLLVMGPDCGTGTIGGQPLAFSNVNKAGSIGLIGASGTGLQAVMAGIDYHDEGLSHAIGLGGRDLSEGIGGISALDAIDFLARDPKTAVITFISKPPAKAVRDRIVSALKAQPKPVVAIFLGEEGGRNDGSITFAGTLDEAAKLAVDAAKEVRAATARTRFATKQNQIRGLYCGGTLASEASLLMGRGLGVPFTGAHDEGIMFEAQGSTVIDLGDDVYTVGRAHPMIDPTLRGEMIVEAARHPNVAVVLMDVVVGYGAHEDPAGQAAEMVEAARTARTEKGEVVFVAYVCGAKDDPQGFEAQKTRLQECGVVVADSNREAVEYALSLIRTGAAPVSTAAKTAGVPKLLDHRPKVINLGLRSFADDILKSGGEVVHVNWAPPAGGDDALIAALNRLA